MGRQVSAPSSAPRASAHRSRSFAWALSAFLALTASCREATEPLRCAALPRAAGWTNLGPSGKWITAVALTPAGLLVGTRSDGVLRYNSCDGRWVGLGLASRFITSITALRAPSRRLLVTVIPLAPDTVSALLYASDDVGTTWYPRDGGLSAQRGYYGYGFSLAFDSSDENRLYLGVPAALVRSLDGGATWSGVFGDPTAPGNAVWAIAPSRSGSARVWAVGQDPRSEAWVLRSDDRGDTWTEFLPLGHAENAVLSVAAGPSNNDRVFIGVGGGILSSADAGSTWHPVLALPAPGFVTGLLLVDSSLVAVADEQVVTTSAIASVMGLYMSRDSGATWDTLPAPPSATGGIALAISPSRIAFIATRSGLWAVPLP